MKCILKTSAHANSNLVERNVQKNTGCFSEFSRQNSATPMDVPMLGADGWGEDGVASGRPLSHEATVLPHLEAPGSAKHHAFSPVGGASSGSHGGQVMYIPGGFIKWWYPKSCIFLGFSIFSSSSYGGIHSWKPPNLTWTPTGYDRQITFQTPMQCGWTLQCYDQEPRRQDRFCA